MSVVTRLICQLSLGGYVSPPLQMSINMSVLLHLNTWWLYYWNESECLFDVLVVTLFSDDVGFRLGAVDRLAAVNSWSGTH